MSSAWRVHKFGGTSLADAGRYRRVASILRSEPGAQKVVVVSAMHKVTDALLQLAERAKNRDDAYLALLDPAGGCSVALQSYPRAHAFAGTSGSDNIVAFTAARYHTNSLIVQGPGAGPEVTAGGVFADLLRLASYLGGSAS